MGYRMLLFDECGDASAGIGDQLKSFWFVKVLSRGLEQGVRQLQDSSHCHESP